MQHWNQLLKAVSNNDEDIKSKKLNNNKFSKKSSILLIVTKQYKVLITQNGNQEQSIIKSAIHHHKQLQIYTEYLYNLDINHIWSCIIKYHQFCLSSTKEFEKFGSNVF